jgi:hypothetical protein
MKTLLTAALLTAFGTSPAMAANDLEAQLAHADGWVAWDVPMVAGMGAPCCFSWRNKTAIDGTCDLDAKSWNFGTDSRHPRDDSTLSVYLHMASGHIDRVHAVAASCHVESANPIRRIETVEPAQSVSVLTNWLDAAGSSRKDDDSALAALAYHADASATRALAAHAEPKHASDLREQALFWLGQARGVEGAHIVEHYATTDADPDMREKAIFALSQSHADDPYAKILAISRSDANAHVRSQALFWMAQMEDARARADITAALNSEPTEDGREQAVFALTQLKEGEADDALIAIVRGSYPREVKKQALFWLGQSGSPRAIAALDEILAKAR